MREITLDGTLLNEARSLRYLLDALDDVFAAEVLLEKGIFNQVLFHCQQASEKGSKGCLSWLGIVLADEHKYADFLQKLVVPNAGKLQTDFKKLMIKISILENYYISARYGVDKQGRIHIKEYEENDATDIFNSTSDFVELCFEFIELKSSKQVPREKKELLKYLKENYKSLIK